jgi:hypothetical protein
MKAKQFAWLYLVKHGAPEAEPQFKEFFGE